MDVKYRNNKIRKACTNASFAGKKYGTAMAEKIQQRIGEIEASPSVEFMIFNHILYLQILNTDYIIVTDKIS